MDIFSNKPKPDAKDAKDDIELRPWRQATRENESLGRTEGTASGGPTASAPTPVAAQPVMTPKNGPTPPENCASVISAGSTWQGTLKIDGSVRIEGRLSGEIEAQDTVHIAEGAQVDAKVNATFVVIVGAFQGQVYCKERLEVMPKSRTRGEITTKLLTVHEGAFIDGQVHMTSDEASANTVTPAVRPSSAPPPRTLREPAPALSGSVTDSARSD